MACARAVWCADAFVLRDEQSLPLRDLRGKGQDLTPFLRPRARLDPISETIEHLSAAWELVPGNLIYTGTPEGVNAVIKGDVMVGTVAGLPDLRVEVV
jgi:hypothetical protein